MTSKKYLPYKIYWLVGLVIAVIATGLLFKIIVERSVAEPLVSKNAAVEQSQSGDNIEGDVIVSDGVRLHYWYYNRGSSTVTIFLHGGPGGSTADFRGSGQALAYANQFGSLLTFDQRGGGQSDRSANLASTITIARFAQDINDLRSALIPNKKVILFGRSWGGVLAVLYANTHPVDVSGYILVSPGTFEGDSATLEAERRLVTTAYGSDYVARFCQQEEETVRNLALEHSTAAELLAEKGTAGENDVDVGTAFNTNEQLFTKDLYASLVDLATVPTLVVYGQLDTQVPPAAVEAMKKYLPSASFIELSGCHGVVYAKQTEFFAAVKTFLSTTTSGL